VEDHLPTVLRSAQAAKAAALSRDQTKSALRVARVRRMNLSRPVERGKPASVEERGKKPPPKDIVDTGHL